MSTDENVSLYFLQLLIFFRWQIVCVYWLTNVVTVSGRWKAQTNAGNSQNRRLTYDSNVSTFLTRKADFILNTPI